MRPGDNVAADGVIVRGEGSFNQANITGEALPVDKKPGDDVFAGTINLTGVLALHLTHTRLQMAVSFVAGLMLGMALLHFPGQLPPWAWPSIPSWVVWR